MVGNSPTEQSLFDKMSSEVTPEVSPLLQFLVNNVRRIFIGVVFCVIAGAGYGIYSWQTHKQMEQAQNDLGKILVMPDSTARLEKLNEFRGKAPTEMKTAVVLAVANAATEAKKYEEAAKAWDELAKDSRSSLYATALIGKAQSLSMVGKDKEALAVLESSTLPPNSNANSLVNSMIVDLAEKTEDMAKAIAACEKLITENSLQNPEEAQFWRRKASILRLQGQDAKE